MSTPTRTSEDTQATRWDKEYPAMGTAPVPVAPCIDPEYFELERTRVFQRTWLYFGREEALPNPGDYRVKTFAVCNAEVLVARGKDGELRAFHNICPHRGNQLVAAESGSCASFSCGFHGWNFGTDGTLRGVPAKKQFFDFDARDYALKQVAIDVWEGFIFVSFAKPPQQSVAEYLGDLGQGLMGYPFANMTQSFRYAATYNANWKVTLDAFQEFYHVPLVHKRSLGQTVRSTDNPWSNSLQIKLHPLHRTFSGYANPDYLPTPTEIAAFKGGMSLSERFTSAVSATEGEEVGAHLPSGVNPTRSRTWSFDVNVVFPNLIIDVLDGMYFTQEFWPLAHDRVYHEINMYFPPVQNAAQLFSRLHGAAELRDSILEDGANLEQVQTALKSGALTHFVLQDEELMIRHGHKVVDTFVYTDDPFEAAKAAVAGEEA